MLEGQIANAIYNGFKGKLLKGVLIRSAEILDSESNWEDTKTWNNGTEWNEEASLLDEYGDPLSAGVVEFPFEGMVEAFSAFYRTQAGIPETDVKILIFAKSITTRPAKDDKVVITNAQTGPKTYQLRKLLEVDPAVATYTCQAFEVKS